MLLHYFSLLNERSGGKAVPLSVIDFLAVASLTPPTERFDALLHTVDPWGLLESTFKGFLIHYRLLWSYYAYLLCYIDFVWFVNMYRTQYSQEKKKKKKMPTSWFPRVSLDQSLYDVAAFGFCSSLLLSGLRRDEPRDPSSVPQPVWFCDFFFVQTLR